MKFMVDEAQFPYCAGCGHTMINQALNSAFELIDSESNLEPTQVNLVSDIGCVGLVDKLFKVNTVHTTHGRSTAFATGLKLADEILFDADTKHIVMIGDGGATIGLLHLVEAAKLNVNITVLLHNNFVYGMTGGQGSGLTPENFRTATSMDGNLVPPIRIAELLKASGASFIARKLATDKDLDSTIAQAIEHQGFSLVEIVELCTGYATKWNSLTRKDIEKILESSNSSTLGVLHQSKRPTFTELYKKQFGKAATKTPSNVIASKAKQSPAEVRAAAKIIASEAKQSLSIILAGTAGEGVQYASRKFLEAKVTEGYNIVLKSDNPVTIGTGYSMTEMKISSEPILYSGVDEPDYILITSDDGLQRVKQVLSKSQAQIVISCDIEEAFKKQHADLNYQAIDFKAQCKNARDLNMMILQFVEQKLL